MVLPGDFRPITMRTYVRVTYPPHIRAKAVELRRDHGMTIDEIAECLAPISRTTIYYWVGGIGIARTTRQTEAQKRATRQMQEQRQRERRGAYQAGRCSFHGLAELDPSFRDFVSLYIGEGYKRNRNKVSVANSDPEVMELAFRWINVLTNNRVRCSLQYHSDQSPAMLRGFWGDRFGIDPGEIAFQRKSNSSQLAGRKWRSQFGVLSVSVGDTRLRARLDGWMDQMKESWVDSAP